MKSPTQHITLKQYITSHNYKRQVQASNRVKSKINENTQESFYSQNPVIPVNRQYRKLLDLKIENVKVYARSVIPNDKNFVQMEKLLEDLKLVCQEEVHNERHNQQIVKTILDIGLAGRSTFSNSQSQNGFKKADDTLSIALDLKNNNSKQNKPSFFNSIMKIRTPQAKNNNNQKSKISFVDFSEAGKETAKQDQIKETQSEIDLQLDTQSDKQNKVSDRKTAKVSKFREKLQILQQISDQNIRQSRKIKKSQTMGIGNKKKLL